MKNFFASHKIVSAGLCMIPAALAITIAAAQDSKTASVPEVRIVRTIKDCREFRERIIHPTRYILSSSKSTPYPPAVVYDIQENTLTEINLRKLEGMPASNDDATGPDRIKLKLTGDFWRISNLDIVYYNGQSSPAGALLEKCQTVKTIPGSPACAKCGAETTLIDKYQRYYCYNCKEYVNEKDYLKDIYSLHYISFDPEKKSVNWIEKFAEGRYGKIGMDPEGKHYYFYDEHPAYKEETTKDSLTLYRFDVESRTIDWRYSVKTPVRSRKTASPTYAMNSFASCDFSRIVLWEYDEEYDIGSRRGWLKNPPAQAHVINVPGKSHFTVNIPSTPYGQVIDRDNRYLLLGSNQYGSLHRVDLDKKKEDLTLQGSRGMFYFTISASGKNVYIFTKTMVEVRSWPDLKIVRTIPLAKIITGVGQLLTSEPMTGTIDGKFAVISVLEKARNGPWWSSNTEAGFYLLSIGD